MLDDEQQQQSSYGVPPPLRALDDLTLDQQLSAAKSIVGVTGKQQSSTTVEEVRVDDSTVYRLFRDGNHQENNNTLLSSEGAYDTTLRDSLWLAFILVRQVLVASAVSTVGPGWAQHWVNYQCDHFLITRAVPYDLQDDGTIVLRQDLSYPVSKSTIPGTVLSMNL